MKQRKWIDLLLFYSTVIIIISGIVLYIMPHGRVAYFTGWSFLGLDKDNWGDLHVIFGLFMAIVIIWHIVLNWKTMKKYLFQKESLIALAITAIISLGAIFSIQPFKSIIDLEENIKNSWEEAKVDIPMAHAELLSISELSQKLNIPLKQATTNLKNAKIKFDINQTLKTIAKNNNTTPNKIYEIIKKPIVFKGMGSGLGKKTLKQVCNENNIDINRCLKILKKHNIDAKPNQTLKEIAFPNNLTPIDVADLIKEQR